MNLVEQAARIIDPDAFQGYEVTGDNAAEVAQMRERIRLRTELHKATALRQATDVLKLALAAGPDALRDHLVAAERDGWVRLGLPAEALDRPEIAKVLRDKYDPARLRAEDAIDRTEG